jgi:hypothetical protein
MEFGGAKKAAPVLDPKGNGEGHGVGGGVGEFVEEDLVVA